MTLKQKKAIDNVLGSGGSMTITDAMRKAGYAETTIDTPTKLTESEAWKEKLGKLLPDEKLLIKHEEALDAMKWNDFTGEREADHAIRLKAVDLGYKIKGKLQSSGININDSKVLIVPSELLGKYAISSNAEGSS